SLRLRLRPSRETFVTVRNSFAPRPESIRSRDEAASWAGWDSTDLALSAKGTVRRGFEPSSRSVHKPNLPGKKQSIEAIQPMERGGSPEPGAKAPVPRADPDA